MTSLETFSAAIGLPPGHIKPRHAQMATDAQVRDDQLAFVTELSTLSGENRLFVPPPVVDGDQADEGGSDGDESGSEEASEASMSSDDSVSSNESDSRGSESDDDIL